MKIQRFRARTTQAALEMARIALGPQALILQTRRVTASGLERFLNRPQVEVLAAVDAAPGGVRDRQPGYPAARPVGPSTRAEGRSNECPPAWHRELSAIRSEVAELRRLLLEQARREREAIEDGRGCEGGILGSPGDVPATQGARETMAWHLLAGLVTRPIEIKETECTVVALVGPTGVGKTTTIAKLAAMASRVERKRVAFIAADTYRIGAVEQLQTYAQLLEVPMTVVYSPEDLTIARERYAEYDLVFMDTVGRSPNNVSQLAELAELLSAAKLDEVHLALDARGSYATQHAVLRAFRVLSPTHLLLSKLDETARLEDSLAAVLEDGLPLSYVTMGQRVPEDLAAASAPQLASWLLGGV
jgi:flagellar biosynthesis protein FlhF